MPKVARIAISLPKDLLVRIERERKAAGQTRSGWIRRALEALLAARRKADRVAEDRAAYERMPETPEEIAESMAWALQPDVWKDLPWDGPPPPARRPRR